MWLRLFVWSIQTPFSWWLDLDRCTRGQCCRSCSRWERWSRLSSRFCWRFWSVACRRCSSICNRNWVQKVVLPLWESVNFWKIDFAQSNRCSVNIADIERFESPCCDKWNGFCVFDPSLLGYRLGIPEIAHLLFASTVLVCKLFIVCAPRNNADGHTRLSPNLAHCHFDLCFVSSSGC